MSVTLTIGIASLIQIMFFGGGLLFHYARSETKNQERYNHMKENINDHEARISCIEQSKTQENGQPTYIPRNECLRERQKLCKRIDNTEDRLNNHETRITVVEKKVS